MDMNQIIILHQESADDWVQEIFGFKDDDYVPFRFLQFHCVPFLQKIRPDTWERQDFFRLSRLRQLVRDMPA